MADIDRLSRLLRMAASPFAGEAKNALNAFLNALAQADVHPGDLELILVNSRIPGSNEVGALIADLRREKEQFQATINALQLENVSLRENLKESGGTSSLRLVQKETRLAEWEEFENLVNIRIFHGRLPKNWDERVADMFEVTTDIVVRWRRGSAVIPYETMASARQLPPPETDIQVIRPSTSPPASIEVVKQIAEMLFAGKTDTEVQDALKVNDPGKMIYTRKPPPEFCIRVKRDYEPTDWWELWEIMTALRGERSWVTNIRSELGANLSFKDADVDQKIDKARLKELRDEYWKRAPYAIFVAVALAKRDQGHETLSSGVVVEEAREYHGLSITNSMKPKFATRFNEEYFPLFRTRESEAAIRKDKKKSTA